MKEDDKVRPARLTYNLGDVDKRVVVEFLLSSVRMHQIFQMFGPDTNSYKRLYFETLDSRDDQHKRHPFRLEASEFGERYPNLFEVENVAHTLAIICFESEGQKKLNDPSLELEIHTSELIWGKSRGSETVQLKYEDRLIPVEEVTYNWTLRVQPKHLKEISDQISTATKKQPLNLLLECKPPPIGETDVFEINEGLGHSLNATYRTHNFHANFKKSKNKEQFLDEQEGLSQTKSLLEAVKESILPDNGSSILSKLNLNDILEKQHRALQNLRRINVLILLFLAITAVAFILY